MSAIAPLTVPIVADDRAARAAFARVKADTAAAARGMTAEVTKVNATLVGMESAFEAASRAASTLVAAQKAVATSADAINRRLSVKSDFGSAARAADIAAYGTELDRLRAKYNPLFAAGREYKATLDEINMALRVGALSEAEHAAALDRTKAAFAAQVPALRGFANSQRNSADAAKLNAGQMQNVTFQLNDMAVMLASGQNPFIMIMQQGMQIAQIFGPGVGVAGALKATGGALMAFVTNPLTLAVVGLAVAAGAVSLFFDAIAGGGRDAEETLKRQADLVARIKDRFGEADGAAKRYQESLASLLFDQRATAAELEKTLRAQLEPLRGLFYGLGSDAGRQYDDDRMEALFRATAKFTDEVRAGKGAVLAYNEEINEIANSDPSNKALQKLARGLRDATKEATTTAEAIRNLNETVLRLQGPGGLFAGNVRRGGLFNGLLQTTDLSAAEKDMASYARFVNEQRVALDRLTDAHRAELAAISAKSPAQKAAAAMERERISLLGQEITAEERALRISQAGALARAQAEYDVAEAQRQRIIGMDESVEAARLELQTLGKTAGETARVTTAFQLLTAARQAARETGTVVSVEEVARIMQTAEAVGALADRVIRLKHASDIARERSLIGLSPEDVQIAERLRDIYGDDIAAALGSAEAEALRLNNRLREVAAVGDAMRESLSGAIADVFTGGAKTAGEFVDALTKGVAKAASDLIASRLTDKLFGGALAPVDAAGARVATALSGAAGQVTAATPPLASAATSLSGAAGALKQAATALSVAGGGMSGGTFAPGAGLSVGVGLGGSALSAAQFNVQAAAAAIKAIESLGSGGYGALGAVIKNGDRAYGAYQVMGNNIASWTKAALGYSMTNEAFLRSAEAQDKVFQHQFGQLVRQFGNVSDAASAWFTGQPLSVGANRSDIHGTTGSAYVDRFNREYAQYQNMPAAVANDNAPAPVNIASVGGKSVSDAADIGGLSPASGVGGALTKLGGVLSSPTFQQGLAGFSMGYQSQSPVMGGLGGAFSGLMAGGPVGALVGGAAGILGGILGKSKAEREALEKAKEAWSAMADEVAAFSRELRGKVSGDLGDAIDSAEARFQKYRRAAKEAGESTDGLARDLAAFTKRVTKEFKRTFDLQVEAYTSGLGNDDPALKAAESMRALRDELLGFVSDARLAGGGRGKEAKRAAKGFVLDQIGGGATAGTTAYDAYLAEEARIMGTRKEAVALLVELGVSEKKARKQVNATIQQALADAQKVYIEAVDQRRMGFADRVFAATTDLTKLEGQLAQFDRQAQRERERELADGGEAMADLERALAAERLKIQQDYQQQSIESAKRAAEEMNQTARSIVEYVNGLDTASDSPLSPTDRFAAAESAYQAQIALAQAGDTAALGSITQYSDAYLKSARDMYASSEDFFTIFNQVKAQLLALPDVQGATAPDVVAMLEVRSAVLETNAAIDTMMTTLQGSIEANSPTAIAAALGPLFDAIDLDASGGLSLAEMQTALGTTNAVLQQIFQTLDADGDGQISKLEQIRAGTGDLATWLSAVNATTAAVNAGVAGVNTGVCDVNTNVGKDDASGLKKWTKNGALAGAATDKTLGKWVPVMANRLYEIAVFTGKAKGVKEKPSKGPDKFKGRINDPNYNAPFAQGGIIGRYARGGTVGNGLWNVDSVRARYAGGGDIMLAGGEGVIPAEAMKMIGPSRFELLRAGQIPGNDNGPHFKMLATSIREDAGVRNRVLVAGFRTMAEGMERLDKRLARLEAATQGTTRAVRDKPVPKPVPLRA